MRQCWRCVAFGLRGSRQMTRGTINERLITTPINQRREEREQPCPVSRSWEVYIASFEVYGPWTCRTTRKRSEPPPEITRGIAQAVNRDVFADLRTSSKSL